MDNKHSPKEASDHEITGSPQTPEPEPPKKKLSYFIDKLASLARGYWLTAKGWFGKSKMSRMDKWALAICLFMAVVLWLYVMSTDDAGYENSLTYVSVNIEGNELLQSNDMSIISGFDSVVTVTLKGKRSDIGGLTAKEIVAYIDVSEITATGRYSLPVKIELPGNSTLVSVEPSSVSVRVDINTERELDIRVMIDYVLDASYTLGALVPDQTTLIVSGPQSVLDTIAYAAVRSDVGAIKTSQKLSGKVYLYDEYNQIIDNPYLKCSLTEVMVSVPVTMTKTVPLTVTFASGISANYDVTIRPAEAVITGDPLILAKIEEIVVHSINDDDYLVGAPVILYISSIDLPEGVTMEDEEKGITVKVEKLF